MAEQVFAATPVLGGGGRVIASPFQFLFTGEDNLRVVIANSKAGVVVRLAGRFLQTGASAPEAFQQDVTPTSDRTANVFDIPMGTGFLLNLSLVVVSGAPLIGQTYAMARIIRGLTGATVVLGALLGGPITAQQHLAYPGSPILSSTDGEPAVRHITGTTPAAGSDILETVPAGARWELLTALATLTCSAAPANREVNFVQLADGARVFQSANTNVQTAGTTGRYSFSPNIGYQTDAPHLFFTLPMPQRPMLLAGHAWTLQTQLLQAGDQWAAPEYVVREWLEVS